MSPVLDEIKNQHYTLMVEYVNILNEVSKLPFFVDNYKGLGFSDKFLNSMVLPRHFMSVFSWRFFIRLFVQSHIKGKLNELKNSYIHLAQTVAVQQNDDNIKWFEQIKEQTVEFSNTLSSWQTIRWLVSIIGSIIGTLVVVYLTANVNTIYQAIIEHNFELFKILSSIISFASLFIMIFISFSFNYKRSLFRPGSGFFWEGILSQQQKESIKNVYLIEDQLFELLGKAKNREFPVDIIAYIQFLVIMAIFLTLWQIITNGHIMLIFMGFSFFLIGVYGLISGLRDRKWR